MDLRRLKHLVTLADARNFGRAALLCHVSQSAFSRSVQAAEEELGLKLFDRGTLEVTCTDAGAFVVERARKLLFENHCLERDVSLYRERLIGDLAFGVGPYPAATLLPRLLVETRNRYPGVNVRVEVNNARYLLDHLRAEELDFYLADLRNVPHAVDLSFTRIGQMVAGFYVRAGHPLLREPRVKAPQLLPYGLASVRVPETVSQALGVLFGLEDGKHAPLALECDDLHLLKAIAMETDTVLACTDAATRQEVENATLVRLDVEQLPPPVFRHGCGVAQGPELFAHGPVRGGLPHRSGCLASRWLTTHCHSTIHRTIRPHAQTLLRNHGTPADRLRCCRGRCGGFAALAAGRTVAWPAGMDGGGHGVSGVGLVAGTGV
mgnify:CR=1 FL=1